jgi:hypothetical protein
MYRFATMPHETKANAMLAKKKSCGGMTFSLGSKRNDGTEWYRLHSGTMWYHLSIRQR